jgi:hypothetical protein
MTGSNVTVVVSNLKTSSVPFITVTRTTAGISAAAPATMTTGIATPATGGTTTAGGRAAAAAARRRHAHARVAGVFPAQVNGCDGLQPNFVVHIRNDGGMLGCQSLVSVLGTGRDDGISGIYHYHIRRHNGITACCLF